MERSTAALGFERLHANGRYAVYRLAPPPESP
jgi:hypothetical protein